MHYGQNAFCGNRARMRGALDSPHPILHDCLGFKQVVACVMIPGRVRRAAHGSILIQAQVVAGASSVAQKGLG